MTKEQSIVYKNHKLARSDLAPSLEGGRPWRDGCKLYVVAGAGESSLTPLGVNEEVLHFKMLVPCARGSGLERERDGPGEGCLRHTPMEIPDDLTPSYVSSS